MVGGLSRCIRGHEYSPAKGCPECRREKNREVMRLRRQDPEIRANGNAQAREYQRKRREDPAYREKQRADSSRYHARHRNDPEYLKRMSARSLAIHHAKSAADPEYVKARREKARATREDAVRANSLREAARKRDRERRETDEHYRARRNLLLQERRAKIYGSGNRRLSKEEWLGICASSVNASGKHECFYCRAECVPTADHIVPLARGGRHEACNVVPVCKRCNSRKNSSLIHEWRDALKVLGAERYAEMMARTQRILRSGNNVRMAEDGMESDVPLDTGAAVCCRP